MWVVTVRALTYCARKKAMEGARMLAHWGKMTFFQHCKQSILDVNISSVNCELHTRSQELKFFSQTRFFLHFGRGDVPN